jgi:sugar lactone lactonase YvrE
MNRRNIYLIAALFLAVLSLATGIIFVSAQAPKEVEAPAQPEVALGQPGLNFRYVQTFGTVTQPYLSDTDHLNYPTGVFAQGNTVWFCEGGGRRALKFSNSGAYLGPQIGTTGFHEYQGKGIWEMEDITVDANGNTWVADPYNSQILAFDASGNYLKGIGDGWGSDNNHFGNPVGIAFDSNGNVYISDGSLVWWSGGNQRILILDSAGNYVNTIGITGVSGTDNSHFSEPYHITIDNNNLYVADRGNQRVQIFNVNNPLAPVYVATLGVTGVSGNDNAHFNNPTGIAVDTSYIYVSDQNNFRIQIFDRSSRIYVATIGSGWWGIGNDQFKGPFDVTVDSAGYLYVADSDNHRIQQFDQTRTYVRTYGTTGVPYLTNTNLYNSPQGIAVDSNSKSIYVVEWLGQRLIKLNDLGQFQWAIGEPGINGDDNQHFAWAEDAAVDGGGRVYVADKANHRIQIYNSSGSYVASIGTTGTSGIRNDQLNNPLGIGITANGDIYVADTDNHRVQIFNSNRVYLGTMGVPGELGSDNLHFNAPNDVIVDSQGNIYVTDTRNQRVQVFTSNRVYHHTLGKSGNSGDNFDSFNEPSRLSVDAADNLYVLDTGNLRVQVFDKDGAYLTTIGGSWGTNTGQMTTPKGLAVDLLGNVYTSDRDDFRLQKFSPGVPGWKQANINGFGDRNAQLGALEVFNGQLYVGTTNWNDLNLIYRTSDGKTWEQVKALGYRGLTLDMTVFNGRLYASTGWGEADNTSARIYRTSDGITWDEVVSNGFGNIENINFDSLAVYQNKIYVSVATSDSSLDGVSIWRSDTGNAGTWTSVMSGGNGDANNHWISALVDFNGYLYAGVGNKVTGTRIWRTSNGTAWTQVNTNGFGDPNNNETITLAVYNGSLYAGIINQATSGQIWRTSDGTTWNPVMTDGFGDPNKSDMLGLYVFENRLYAISNNGVTGTKVWSTTNGSQWSQVNINGWGDSNNGFSLRGNGITNFNNNLFIGVMNFANGGEIWQMLRQVYLPFTKR